MFRVCHLAEGARDQQGGSRIDTRSIAKTFPFFLFSFFAPLPLSVVAAGQGDRKRESMLKKFMLVLVGFLALAAVVVPLTSSATHAPTLLADDASKGSKIGG